ncbi:hypothetical protein P7410_27045 [Vibrio parahaemolyticus]|nr:hypothetical protein [Vibrio parahaemolyticus]MDG3027270.1 hypothetical protein [Vibrio parahaemolyticus]HCG7776228.1 hypothetical protein [Vibrio parahaemolyticus]
MKNFCFPLLVVLAGCSNMDEVPMTSFSDGDRKCVNPTPEYFVSESSIDVSGKIEENEASVGAKTNKKVEKIEVDNAEMDAFKRLHFHLCQDYEQGRISKQYYQDEVKKLIDKVSGSKKKMNPTPKN